MKKLGMLAAVLLSFSYTTSGVQAQNLNKVQAPAEFPPASYAGRQYVDSKGCVFIRAGIDGNVTWIPRVSRSRKLVCGFKPTGVRGSTQIASKPVKKAPEIISVATPAAAAAPAVKPAPKAVRQVTRPARQVTQPAPAPRVVAAPQPTVTAPARPTTRQVAQSRCQGASPISNQYLTAPSRFKVRCGPQANHPGQYRITSTAAAPQATNVTTSTPTTRPVRTGTGGVLGNIVSAIIPQQGRSISGIPAATPENTSANTRITPRHVYYNQKAGTYNVYIPEGFAPAWTDDRLNPRRAHMTFNGIAQTNQIFTRTVPRQLITDGSVGISSRNGGDPLSRSIASQPGYQQQIAHRTNYITNSTAGYRSAAPRVASQPRQATRIATQQATRQPVQTAQTQAQSTGTKRARTTSTGSSKTYLQAAYTTSGQQGRTIAQRIANAGMPAKIGKTTMNGQQYTSVVVGPFRNNAQAQQALGQLRRMGLSNARMR